MFILHLTLIKKGELMKKTRLFKVLSIIMSIVIALIILVPGIIYALPSPPWAEMYSYDTVDCSEDPYIKQYLLNMGYDTRWYMNTTAYYVRRTMYQDAVFHIHTHGWINGGRVQCVSGTQLSAKSVPSQDYNYSLQATYGNSTDKLKYTRLTYWAACHSAEYSSTYGDLDNYCYYTLGVDSTVAFWGVRKSPYAIYFDKMFYYCAKQDNNVAASLLLAEYATKQKWPDKPKEGHYDYRYYGGSIKLKPASYGTY